MSIIGGVVDVGAIVDLDTVHSSLWAQAQQLEGLVEQTQPLPQRQHELQRVQPAASVSTFVAMVHCLGTLEHSLASDASHWQPGRRDYWLLANMMLRGLQRVEADPCGASPWTTLLPMVFEVFLLSYRRSPRQSALEDTAGLAAAALLKGAWRLIAKLPLPGEAPDIPSLVAMGDVVTCAISYAIDILSRLRCAAARLPRLLNVDCPDPWCCKQLFKRMHLTCDDHNPAFASVGLACLQSSNVNAFADGPRQQK